MRRFASIALILALAAPAMTGCASKYGDQRTAVNYYPACYAPIRDLRDRENEVGKTTAGGAVIGALGGALVGLLATGKLEGAAVGAAAGGATGAVAGNIYAKNRQQADDNARLYSYLQNLDGDIGKLDVESAAARTSIQCYNQQFNRLVAAIKARQIGRQEAASRYLEIHDGYEEAQNILGNAAATGEDLARRYEEALASEERDMLTPQKASARPASAQKNRQALNAARQRNRQLAQKAQSTRQEKERVAREVANNDKQINELLGTLEDTRI